MIFRKPNILAIKALINEWQKHVDEKCDIKTLGVCFDVGYMAMGYSGGFAKPISCGFTISITPCMNSLDYIHYDTRFTQSKDGIVWKIIFEHKGKKKVLHQDTIRDVSILTDEPCPSLVKERMFKVALASVDLALVKQRLMHL